MIEIHYKCGCMTKENSLFVREREKDEDIIDYMENVIKPALTNHHRQTSPICVSPAVEYLKIPLDEQKPIGQVNHH